MEAQHGEVEEGVDVTGLHVQRAMVALFRAVWIVCMWRVGFRVAGVGAGCQGYPTGLR